MPQPLSKWLHPIIKECVYFRERNTRFDESAFDDGSMWCVGSSGSEWDVAMRRRVEYWWFSGRSEVVLSSVIFRLRTVVSVGGGIDLVLASDATLESLDIGGGLIVNDGVGTWTWTGDYNKYQRKQEVGVGLGGGGRTSGVSRFSLL